MNPRRTVVVVPLKRFDTAKSRLRGTLVDEELSELARRLAEGVIRAAAPRECVVLGDDEQIAEFARTLGARFVRVSSDGLNAAIDDGLEQLRGDVDLAVIAHGDLARPLGLGTYVFDDGLTIVTDRHGTGTNVLAVSPRSSFRAQYGEGSAARHIAQGQRLGLAVNVVRDSPWALDIDGPDDWQIANQPRT